MKKYHSDKQGSLVHNAFSPKKRQTLQPPSHHIPGALPAAQTTKDGHNQRSIIKRRNPTRKWEAGIRNHHKQRERVIQGISGNPESSRSFSSARCIAHAHAALLLDVAIRNEITLPIQAILPKILY